MTYISTKTYGHEVGLSCAFRQWRADSHCRMIHGYALSVRLEFEADVLDDRNWVIDFGALKEVKAWLADTFDHKLILAADDPHLEALHHLDMMGVASVIVLDAVGCEAFARFIYAYCALWLERAGHAPRVWMRSVEVREHGANSAIYGGHL